MAFTTPRTWSTGEVVTAALLNAQIKGNMDLSAPAIMTTAGDIIYASGANTPARLAKDTNATRVLTNTGTSNVPAWAQVTLTSGVTGTLPVGNGGTGATTLTDGGVLIGNGTGAMVAMAVLADGEMIVGDGTTDPVAESGATLRTSIGIGTGNSPQFTGIELSHATANTLTASSGVLSIECNRIFHAGGTDIPVADGGTGASTFTANGILVGNGTSAIAVTATMATKGHLMVGDGSGVPSMLAVGNNCLVLTACSSEGTGVKWAAAGGGLNSCADAIINNGYGIVLGNSAQLVAGDNPGNVVAEFQMVGTGSADTSMHLIAHSADAEPAIIRFAKSRNATIGSHTAVQACDIIGSIDYFGCDGGDMQPYAARIMVKVDGTPGANDMPGRIEFHTTADGAQSATSAVTINSSQQVLHVNGTAALPSVGFSGDVDTGSFLPSAGNIGWSIGGSEAMRLNSNKGLFINETADSKTGAGALVANQAAADDPQFILKSSDVAHNICDIAEPDTYAFMKKSFPNGGGLNLYGITDGNGCQDTGIILTPVSGTGADTAHSAAGIGLLTLNAGVKAASGTGVANAAGGGNLFAIRDLVSGNAKMLVDQEGDLFLDATLNASHYDSFCDAQLTRALSTTIDNATKDYDMDGNLIPQSDREPSQIIKNKWDEFTTYNEQSLIDAGILGAPVVGVDLHNRGLVNVAQLQRLHNGAIWQLHSKLNDQAEDIIALKGQINALTEGK
jgi:hypothetical protein